VLDRLKYLRLPKRQRQRLYAVVMSVSVPQKRTARCDFRAPTNAQYVRTYPTNESLAAAVVDMSHTNVDQTFQLKKVSAVKIGKEVAHKKVVVSCCCLVLVHLYRYMCYL